MISTLVDLEIFVVSFSSILLLLLSSFPSLSIVVDSGGGSNDLGFLTLTSSLFFSYSTIGVDDVLFTATSAVEEEEQSSSKSTLLPK